MFYYYCYLLNNIYTFLYFTKFIPQTHHLSSSDTNEARRTVATFVNRQIKTEIFLSTWAQKCLLKFQFFNLRAHTLKQDRFHLIDHISPRTRLYIHLLVRKCLIIQKPHSNGISIPLTCTAYSIQSEKQQRHIQSCLCLLHA